MTENDERRIQQGARDREVLLRHALAGDAADGAEEIRILAATELRNRCRSLISTREIPIEGASPVDWASIVEEAAHAGLAPTLDEAQPDLLSLLNGFAGEARSLIPAARERLAAASLSHSEDAERVRLARADAGFVPSARLRGLRRRALAGAWALWLAEGAAVGVSAAATADGVLDYASVGDVPLPLLLPELAFGTFAAAAFFGLQALLTRAARTYGERRGRARALVAMGLGVAAILFAGALGTLRLGGIPLPDAAAAIASGSVGGAKAVLLFLGIPAVALWAELLRERAGAAGAGARRAEAEERAWAERLAAAEAAVGAARADLGRLEARASSPDDLRARYGADVSAYRTEARVGSAEVRRRVLAFGAELAELRSRSRPELERWVAEERRRLAAREGE